MDLKLFDQIPLFEKLNDEERSKLAELFILRRHQKNTIVINEGDNSHGFYVIIEGETRVYLTDEQGKEVVLNIQSTGEYFGEVALLDDGLCSASVITTQPSQFAVLNHQAFIDCVTENPQISLKIIQGLTRRLRALSDNVRSLALMDVYGRVVRLLLELAVDSEGKKVIENKLTQNDIADRVGASSKMVGRIMQDLKKGGYILKDEKRLIIAKPLPAAW